jgi:hypothetical protein
MTYELKRTAAGISLQPLRLMVCRQRRALRLKLTTQARPTGRQTSSPAR